MPLANFSSNSCETKTTNEYGSFMIKQENLLRKLSWEEPAVLPLFDEISYYTKKTPVLQKDESLIISRYHLMFIDNSRCLPLRVRPYGLYSSTLTDAGTVAAYYPQFCRIWCEAQRCIHTKLPMRLSSTGCFLYDSLCATSSYHCFS